MNFFHGAEAIRLQWETKSICSGISFRCSQNLYLPSPRKSFSFQGENFQGVHSQLPGIDVQIFQAEFPVNFECIFCSDRKQIVNGKFLKIFSEIPNRFPENFGANILIPPYVDFWGWNSWKIFFEIRYWFRSDFIKSLQLLPFFSLRPRSSPRGW